MTHLGNPQDKVKSIHVAGTSGKTSTSYYIAKLLSINGLRTGLAVSPHVYDFRERFQIDLQLASSSDTISKLKEFIEIVNKSGIKPTYFEFLTAFSFWFFNVSKVQYSVIETGIGGLLDSTNVINSEDKICVITDIGMDHTEVLGNSITDIAKQKAGIINSKNNVFMNSQSELIINEIKNKCLYEKAKLTIVNNKNSYNSRNLNLANTVAEFISNKKLNESTLNKFRSITIPGRFEIINKHNKTIILDGAHNPQKLNYLKAQIKDNFPNQDIRVVLSFSDSKQNNLRECLDIISQISKYIVLTEYILDFGPKIPISAEIIQKEAIKLNKFNEIKVIKDHEMLVNNVLRNDKQITVVTGSFYLLNNINSALRQTRYYS